MGGGNKDNVFGGAAGEYFVAYELAKNRGHAKLTKKNAESVDILCTNGKKTVEIQVKTSYRTRTTKEGWRLIEKNENGVGDNKYYCFVNLNGMKNKRDYQFNAAPDVYIFPSRLVAESIREGYKKWLENPGKKGQRHNDTPTRSFPSYKNFNNVNLDSYKNNGKILGE